MGCRVADMVGEWAIVPDCFDGNYGYCGEIEGAGKFIHVML